MPPAMEAPLKLVAGAAFAAVAAIAAGPLLAPCAAGVIATLVTLGASGPAPPAADAAGTATAGSAGSGARPATPPTESAATPARGPGAGPEGPLAWKDLLAAAGLTSGDLRLDREEMGLWGESPWRLPLFELFRADPTRLEPYTRSFREQALQYSGSAGDALAFVASRAGLPVRRGLVADQDPLPQWKRLASSPGALADSLLALRAGGSHVSAAEDSSLREAAGRVPALAAAPAALLLRAIAAALQWREAALSPLGEARATLGSRALAALLAGDKVPPDLPLLRSLERDSARVDLRRLVAGAEDLARAADAAAAMLADPAVREAGSFSFRFDTPYGAVLLRGTGADKLALRDAPAGGILLLLDLGGDDTYETAAVGTEPLAAQVWIDVSGNDTYRTAPGEIGAFGAGVAGYGLLLDLAGDDTYAAGPVSLGAGLYGVGVLEDRGGRDVYQGAELTQGAGQFGMGLLADLEGNDEYHAVQMAQGYGGVAGAGLLADRAGNDLYEAADAEHLHPSPQAPEHGSSLAQGCAAGNRADYIDAHSEAGGIGMLFDGSGNDTYRAEVFAQGCGYWYGIGLLSDGGGDDSYQAAWYAQGSAAHFAIGFLLDESGADRYAASLNMAQGAGHDFSFGELLDISGDDRYESPNLSLGAGNDNGIGVFWDRGGDDLYRATGLTLGRAAITAAAGGPRDLIKCVGLFLDTGAGADRYEGPGAGRAANGSVWRQECTTGPGARPEIGVGLDR